jgi:hypothetical protein
VVQGCLCLVWFGSRFHWFGSRWLQCFKIASVWFSLVQEFFSSVPGCFSLVWCGSRLFQLFKVASKVQGHVSGSAWHCFSSFEGYLFWFKNSSVWFKIASMVQGHVSSWFGSLSFIWFKVASLQILMSQCSSRQITTSLSVDL